ncbi:MAG TPA: hypothetical protein VMZ03_04085 [Chitinophagaceae bacterium]|nr:hypothetical protein [Chitinophagaceae bacterium]
MKRKIACFFPLLVFSLLLLGQSKRTKKTRSPGDNVSAGISINFPIGNFSSSHTIGPGLDVSPASHQFGLMGFKKIAFAYNGGVAYYFGKEVRTIDFSYKYPGFTFIHTYAGLLYTPLKKLSATLLAGPALGIYKKDTRFNIGARLEGSYYIRKTNIAAGPLLNMMWETGADPLWSAGIKMRMDL